MLKRLVIENIWIAYSIILGLRRRGVALLVSVDWRYGGSRIAMACLLAVSDEVLQILYRGHDRELTWFRRRLVRRGVTWSRPKGDELGKFYLLVGDSCKS